MPDFFDDQDDGLVFIPAEGSRTLARVLVRRPRCPHCREVDVVTKNTRQLPPDAIERRMQCRSCGKAFVAILD